MRYAPIALALCLGLAMAAEAAEPDPDIFAVLTRQPYKSNFARLAKAKTLPDWVPAILKKGEGTTWPTKTVEIAGKSYRLDHVCKPHDCADNSLDVLWAPGGTRVWAALIDGGRTPPTMLGNPPPAETKALSDAVAAAPK